MGAGRRKANVGYEAVIAWIIIGGVAGWLAGLIVEGYGFGLWGNVIVGSIGAALAAGATIPLGIGIETKLGSILAATAGAVVLLLAIGLLRRR